MNIKTLLFGAFVASSVFASADTFTKTVDLTGVTTNAVEGDAANYFQSYDFGSEFAGYSDFVLTGIAYDLNLTANSPSWLSEIAFSFLNSESVGVYLTPGIGVNSSGTGTYADEASLVDLGLDFALLGDNILTLEAFETFNDSSVAIDGIVNSGTVTFTFEAQPVPEPATLAALGLGAAALLRRRKKA